MKETRAVSRADWVSARTVLWWLVFTGTAVNYVIRMSINIAIIGMVRDRSSGADSLDTAERCYNATVSEGAGNVSRLSSLVDTDEDKVDWDEYQQNLVLGASFWLYWLTQVPGGVLSQRYGTKLVFGLSNFTMCLLGLLIPFATFRSFHLLIAIRVLQGLAGGFAWPALHAMIGAWIPPNERSKFMSSYTGANFGTALCYSLGGPLVLWLGWRSVGALGLLWTLVWSLLMFDSPDSHPRISQEERRFINDSVAGMRTEKLPTPWKAILLSRPMWLVFVTYWGFMWCLMLTLTQAPTYLYVIHGWDLNVAGAMSALTQLMAVACAVGLSVVFDWLLEKGSLSQTGIRKLAIGMGCMVQGGAMVGLAFSGCNSALALGCMLLAVCMQGLETSGHLASIVDLSPNFASVVLGIMNSLNSLTGFVAPMVVGLLTRGNQTTAAWQQVFLVSAAMVVLPDVLHLFLGTSELQPWNSPHATSGEELQLEGLNSPGEVKEEEAEKK